MISSKELRASFLDFFKKNQHHIEKSAPLIPYDDPSLLFVNAGMVPFKNVFTKKEERPYKRAASSQKCVRAGGKHNDLENVGQTARHHTFFEMLGNFSFGDYFKEEAITLAWRFLTEVVKLDKSRLSVTIFAGDDQVPADEEAARIWHEKIGLAKDKIKRLGRADNFWQMGDSGPCGPSTEIHFDRGDAKVGFGGQEEEGDRNIEVWNLVFMQYEMGLDQSLKALPAPCVDTGMGLERLACVVNNYASNYDSDLLRPLIDCAAALSKKSYLASSSADDMAMRVIADHARATAFLIADGLFPSNEGRGYVLRRIMRRAIRHGSHLGLKDLFFHEICLKVASIMGEIYPELQEAQALIEKVVMQEEVGFRKTLDRGLHLFAEKTAELKKGDLLGGELVFRLYETYGFPKDLTEDLAKERGILINWQDFSAAEKEHELRSSSALGLKGIDDTITELRKRLSPTEFVNKEKLSAMKVIALLENQSEVEELSTLKKGVVIFDKSPFYGESGGQVGDTGFVSAKGLRLRVVDCKKLLGLHLHHVEVLEGSLRREAHVEAEVDWSRRKAIMRNHSATHLLHAALRNILGSHVTQKGSLVAPDRLRFDFAHFSAMTKEEINAIEDMVNAWILANEEVHTKIMTQEEARAYGALALFGEKYENTVRVIDMGSHSTELCGGSHCQRTGDVGAFKIISEGPLAQGIRRIEAITGLGFIDFARSQENILKNLSLTLQVKADDISTRIDALIAHNKELEKAAKSKSIDKQKERVSLALKNAHKIGAVTVIAEIAEHVEDAEELKNYADLLRSHMTSGLVILGLKRAQDNCLLLLASTKDLLQKIHLGKIVAQLAPIIGGKGGGRPDFAQAGGTNAAQLEEALKKAQELLEKEILD
jgi:alanyl-tRNA synthetase